ncbi:uncharacterized protein [Scyliorhinus torazame]|uniref:uncharacterized protein isoform X2 n=1 Tax=Scyliorhinus torazame TaxID=75743 RepID=UPI003B5BBDC7
MAGGWEGGGCLAAGLSTALTLHSRPNIPMSGESGNAEEVISRSDSRELPSQLRVRPSFSEWDKALHCWLPHAITSTKCTQGCPAHLTTPSLSLQPQGGQHCNTRAPQEYSWTLKIQTTRGCPPKSSQATGCGRQQTTTNSAGDPGRSVRPTSFTKKKDNMVSTRTHGSFTKEQDVRDSTM